MLQEHASLLSSVRLLRASHTQAHTVPRIESAAQRLQRIANGVQQQRDDCAHVLLQLKRQHAATEESNRALRVRLQSMAWPLRDVVASVAEAKALAESHGGTDDQSVAASQAKSFRVLLDAHEQEARGMRERLAAAEDRASAAEAHGRQLLRERDAAQVRTCPRMPIIQCADENEGWRVEACSV